jgi:YcxB-like protein
MQEQAPISLCIKLKYWEVYRLNVVLTVTVFRKVLYIWGFVAMLWLALSLLLLFRPLPEHDRAVTMQNTSPLKWVFGLPVLLVFILPLLSARRVLTDKTLKRGVSYQFSDSGFHVETAVSKTDFTWAAIHRVSEARSEFLVFTKPNIAFALPKRCLESTEGVAALRELFRVHVPRAKLHRD